jgi:ADP-ribose pyrophosphatase
MAQSRPTLQVRGHQEVARFGEFMRINAYTVRFPMLNGSLSEPVERIDVYRGDAVAGLLHRVGRTGAHELFFVRQFRFSTVVDADTGHPDFRRDGMIIELMAGMRKPGEPWLETLRRETEEETGFRIEEEVFINSFFPSPGACSEQIHLYYARIATAGDDVEARVGWGADVDEETERLTISPKDFLAMVERGEIQDAKCLAAAEWMRRKENRSRFSLD